MNEEDIKRIEKKIDLLFKLCFKNESNYTFSSFLWDEIKECIPLFGITAKKIDIKDFLTEEDIDKYRDKIRNLHNQYHPKNPKELERVLYAIEKITRGWFHNVQINPYNLKDNIEKNYRAQFVNDMFKKLGIKRREDDCSEFIEKAIKGNKQLKEIFKEIDKKELE